AGTGGAGGSREAVVGCPVGDQSDAGRLGRVAVEQPVAGRRCHGDDRVGDGQHPLQHLSLVRGRVDEHGVEHDDDRGGEPVQDGQDLVAVGAAVDAVLVLDDHGVEAVEDGGGLCFTARGGGDELMDDVGAGTPLEPV